MQIRLPLNGETSIETAGAAERRAAPVPNSAQMENGMYELDDSVDRAKIKVVGVGGAGGNAVNTMIASQLSGVDFIAANTDAQALRHSRATHKIQLGANLTKGLGAGSNPEIGRQSALEDRDRIADMLTGSDMVFVTAGMGGGTGTGAAPVIAQIAREVGALTVGVVTKPFKFEGNQRAKLAEEGLRHMRNAVDSLLIIPNDRLLQQGKKLTLKQSLELADSVLYQAVRGISDIIQVPGLINVDFADVRTVMANQGLALMGVGEGQGENRAVEAAMRAISSPLLDEVNIKGARGVLINISAASEFGADEMQQAIEIIEQETHQDKNFKFGVVFDDTLGEVVRITVIATGFDEPAVLRAQAMQSVRRTGTDGAAMRSPMGSAMGAAGVGTQGASMRESSVQLRSEARPPSEPALRRETQVKRADDWSEYDVPAFLRKQRD